MSRRRRGTFLAAAAELVQEENGDAKKDFDGRLAAVSREVSRFKKRSEPEFRASIFSSGMDKAGLLSEIKPSKSVGKKSSKKPVTRYLEVGGKYLRYYGIKQGIMERLRRTSLTLNGGQRRSIEIDKRVRRDQPLACIDLRLVVVELDENARENFQFAIRNATGDDCLILRARSFGEAKAWVDCMKRLQDAYQEEQLRRSLAISMGIAPQKVHKNKMENLATTYPAIDLVTSFPRRKMKETSRRLIEKTGDRNGFSILSFNILANQYVAGTKRPEMYAHCDKDSLPWDYRVKKIIKQLVTSNADLICLQEVERWTFENDILRALRGRGYAGEIVCNERKGGGEVPGTATLYKTNVFKCVWNERSYRSLVLGFEILQGREKGSVLASANSHLEGNPLKEKERAGQMQGVFKKLRRRVNDFKFVILCGDYNDGARSDLCQKILAGEGFMSCYDGHDARDATCLLTPDDADAIDIERARVDHIFFDSRLRVRAVMEVIDPSWSREATIEQGLPSLLWPSDHLSIGAVLKFNQDSEKFLLKDSSDEDAVDPFSVFSSHEIFLDDELNPLSEDERTEFRLHEKATTFNNAMKPSAEDIEYRKKVSADKEAFIASLEPEKQQFLRKYIALRRKELREEEKQKKDAGKSQNLSARFTASLVGTSRKEVDDEELFS